MVNSSSVLLMQLTLNQYAWEILNKNESQKAKPCKPQISRNLSCTSGVSCSNVNAEIISKRLH